jgi:uncharacterized membrane protein
VDGYKVRIGETGYIQYVDLEALLDLASEKKLVIRLLHNTGHFVRRDSAIALVWPAGQVGEQLDLQICHTFQMGSVRTPTQDVAYAFNQLVEMAVRAMSPAINDPFTAMTCLDYLGEGLAQFIRQGEKDPHYYDSDGRLCLICEPVTFEELLSAAFDMLRHASCNNARILLQMLEVIDVIGQETRLPDARQALARHVRLIQAEYQGSLLIDDDRQLLHERSEAMLVKFLGAGENKNFK